MARIELEVFCPFCRGEKGELSQHPMSEKWTVVCISCACEGPWARSPEFAVSQWNRRPVMEDGKLVLRVVKDRELPPREL